MSKADPPIVLQGSSGIAICTMWSVRLVRLWATVAVFIALLSAAGAQPPGDDAAHPKQVLFLYSYGQSFQPWLTWSREIRRELDRQSPWPLSIQEHDLMTALAGSNAAEAKFIEYLTTLYAKAPPDLIVAFGAPAARFVQQYRHGLFPGTPMLLAAVNIRRVDQTMMTDRDAVVGTVVEHVPLIANILQLLPKTENIAVIIGDSPPERFWVEQLREELGPLLGDSVKLLFFNEQPLDRILESVAKLPANSAIFFQQLMVDGAGAVYGDKDPLKRILSVANAPVFTFDQSLFEDGVVGGPMNSPVEGARPTAAAAIRLLQGERAADITYPPIAFSAPTYDWRQLQRWNISESRLPPGSEVVFREPTAWQLYRWEIVLVTAALLLQAALIAVLLRERFGRQSAEMQVRQRMAELAHVNRFSTAGEMSALIAHEINQPLGAILSNAEAARLILQSPTPDTAALGEIVNAILRSDERAAEVIRSMRALLKKAPAELVSLDLSEVARETVEFLSMLARGRKVELVSLLAPNPLPIVGDRIQLQQVILNLIVNGIDAMETVRAESRTVSVRTARDKGFAELVVTDNGPGIPGSEQERVFEPFYSTKTEGMGMGLSIARTIVEAHNGSISVVSRGEGGAAFSIRLPLDASARRSGRDSA